MNPRRLFIQIQNNQPIRHPVFESNLVRVIPNFDGDNPPSDWIPFIRLECPLPDEGNLISSSSVSYDWTANGEMIYDNWTYTQESDPDFVPADELEEVPDPQFIMIDGSTPEEQNP